MNRTRTNRRALAAIWALVVLAVVTTVSAAAIAQIVAARRQIDGHRHRLQADWLAQSGFEIATAGILADPESYTGEAATLIPHGEIKIVVARDATDGDTFKIEVTARYPADDPTAAVSHVRRPFKRTGK